MAREIYKYASCQCPAGYGGKYKHMQLCMWNLKIIHLKQMCHDNREAI